MAHAQSVPVRKGINQRLQALEQQVSEQSRQIEVLRQRYREQMVRYQDLERTVAESTRNAPMPVTAEAAPAGNAAVEAGPRPVRVGVAPAEERQPPAVAPLFDQPGILEPVRNFVCDA